MVAKLIIHGVRFRPAVEDGPARRQKPHQTQGCNTPAWVCKVLDTRSGLGYYLDNCYRLFPISKNLLVQLSTIDI